MSDALQSIQHRIKDLLRQGAIRLCRGLLRMGSQLYELGEGPTVIIAPHQDDETLACGGIISRKRNEGLSVDIIFITDGSASHPQHPRLDAHALAQLRKQEAMRALSCLKVERPAVHFLSQTDGTLHRLAAVEREVLIVRLTALLRTIAPVEIFLPCMPDGSSEHDAVFGFVTDAIARSGLKPAIWQYPVWSWRNPLLLLRRWLATNDCRRLPLEDNQQAKFVAIQCYQSQIAPLPPDTTAALPADLVKLFQTDAEYFFRYRLPANTGPAA